MLFAHSTIFHTEFPMEIVPNHGSTYGWLKPCDMYVCMYYVTYRNSNDTPVRAGTLLGLLLYAQYSCAYFSHCAYDSILRIEVTRADLVQTLRSGPN